MSKKKNGGAPAASSFDPAPAFTIRYPLLWLAAIAFLVYSPTLSMGMTDLDDGILINSFHDLNEHLINLVVSFQRTIFGTAADQYYRPLITDVMILNYQLADHGHNLVAYHLVSILMHITAVLVLYRLFIKLGIKELHSFILVLLFAVHPVLTETVAWICARIESLLAIFICSFFISTINYTTTGKLRSLVFAALFLLCALFTKETAIAAAPAAFVILAAMLHKDWRSKNSITQYAVWTICYAIWWGARSAVLASHTNVSVASMPLDLMHRLPVAIQYLGKIFFPFSLSVFPNQDDTLYYYGIAATLVLATLLFLNKKANKRIILTGICIFILFLLPAFIVPKALSEETYEYRLYIPFIGILLLLSQTTLFQNKLRDKQLLAAAIGVACLFGVLNYNYQKSYEDPLAFWSQAATSSPHSSYANMMLAARIGDPQKSNELFLKAFALNPKEHYVNYIYGVMLQDKDSIQASEKYLLEEKKITGYYKCDLYLARVAIERKDLNTATTYLENYLKTDKSDTLANNNLLVLYLDNDHDDKAKEQAIHMQQMGLPVPKSVIDHFHL